MTKIPLKDYQNAKKLSTDVFAGTDQDKDGFKLENVRPTFSSFGGRNAVKIGCTLIFWFNLSS